MVWIEGIDVSKWQLAPVSLPEGCRFAIVKASQGSRSRDKRMAAHHEEFGRRGIARGAYHYYDFGSSPEANAANFLKATAGRTWELPHALDAEHGGTGNSKTNAEMLLRFLNSVEAGTGRVPFVYTYASWWNSNVHPDPAFRRFPLWIARYPGAYVNGNAPPTNAGTTPAKPWTSWAIWQFSTTNDRLDRNVCTPAVFVSLTQSTNPQGENLMVTDEDEAKIRKIIKDELKPIAVGIIADFREAQKSDDAEKLRDGSVYGWLRAVAAKVGATRDEAVKYDPMNKR